MFHQGDVVKITADYADKLSFQSEIPKASNIKPD